MTSKSRKYGSPKKGRSKSSENDQLDKEVFSKGIVRSGTRMTPQSGNIGGRVMIMQAMKSHNDRLKKTSSSVDTSKPWGYDKLKSTPNKTSKKSRPTSRSRGRPKSRSRPSSKGSSRHSRRQARPSSKPTHRAAPPSYHQPAVEEQTVDPFFDLLPHQRDVYDKFVEMLTAVGTGKLRFVASQAAADAEERLLLSDYTGIDNYFDRMLEPHRAEQQHLPQQRVQPQMQPSTPPANVP
eukprot:CAMPEP_0117429410 /NCGR_PEP_ID=MMETSP0758-20121206/8977_1 /TAXON_ID=63605 /ORGANISM="Percolomonas cosmopolitus, Strain AE-1 (ATCC 50343)" /LENGTH=236 /DNA_ID=CAMNT_0005216457 /DNA_START=52 /DNA_END=758 /DNA_ORIENTATION=-